MWVSVYTNLAFELHFLLILPPHIPISPGYPGICLFVDRETHTVWRIPLRQPRLAPAQFNRISIKRNHQPNWRNIQGGRGITHCRFWTKINERTIPPKLYISPVWSEELKEDNQSTGCAAWFWTPGVLRDPPWSSGPGLDTAATHRLMSLDVSCSFWTLTPCSSGWT